MSLRLKIGEYRNEILDDHNKITKFPKIFPNSRIGATHKDRRLKLNTQTRSPYKSARHTIDTLYACENNYRFLNPNDVIEIDETEDAQDKRIIIHITNRRLESGGSLLMQYKADLIARHNTELQIGRKLSPAGTMTVLEFKQIYDWQINDVSNIPSSSKKDE